MPFTAIHRTVGIQIIEIMQVIKPQFFCNWIVPRRPGCDRSGFIQKDKDILGDHALSVLAWRHPHPHSLPAWGRHLEVGAGSVKTKAETPKDLGGAQMTNRMKVK